LQQRQCLLTYVVQAQRPARRPGSVESGNADRGARHGQTTRLLPFGLILVGDLQTLFMHGASGIKPHDIGPGCLPRQ